MVTKGEKRSNTFIIIYHNVFEKRSRKGAKRAKTSQNEPKGAEKEQNEHLELKELFYIYNT